MDAISCLSAFTDLCFLPETSFDRQGARVWVRWSSRRNRQRRRRKLQRYDTNRTKGHFFDKIYIISIFCPSWWWSLFQEERLREEAAKRLERRRKKMLSPEERLARWFLSLDRHLDQIMKVNCWFEWNQQRLARRFFVLVNCWHFNQIFLGCNHFVWQDHWSAGGGVGHCRWGKFIEFLESSRL